MVNPGSVGWPAYADENPHPHRVEAGAPEARFAILSRTEDGGGGGWTAELLAVPYDYEEAASSAERFGRPDLAHMLRTGRLP